MCENDCEERPFEEFEDFETTRDLWHAELVDAPCGVFCPSLVVGECQDGVLLLHRGRGFASIAYFFDAETAEFIGLATESDFVQVPCYGRGYWPEPIECADAIVTEVLLGTLLEEGDDLSPFVMIEGE